MNKFLKTSLMAIALIFLFNVFAVSEIKAQRAVNDILKLMDAHNKSLQTLQANVQMDKYNAQLGEHDINEGTTKYLPQKGKDALVRIDWTKPSEESLSVIKKEYVLYRPRLNQAIIGKIDKAQSKNKGASNALSFINMSKAQLQANYSIAYGGQENVSGIPTFHLVLTPKKAQQYKSSDLWVDGNGMPIQAKVNENNSDSTTVYLSNLKKNETINPKIFVIDLPKNVKIIKS